MITQVMTWGRDNLFPACGALCTERENEGGSGYMPCLVVLVKAVDSNYRGGQSWPVG